MTHSHEPPPTTQLPRPEELTAAHEIPAAYTTSLLAEFAMLREGSDVDSDYFIRRYVTPPDLKGQLPQAAFRYDLEAGRYSYIYFIEPVQDDGEGQHPVKPNLLIRKFHSLEYSTLDQLDWQIEINLPEEDGALPQATFVSATERSEEATIAVLDELIAAMRNAQKAQFPGRITALHRKIMNNLFSPADDSIEAYDSHQRMNEVALGALLRYLDTESSKNSQKR